MKGYIVTVTVYSSDVNDYSVAVNDYSNAVSVVYRDTVKGITVGM